MKTSISSKLVLGLLLPATIALTGCRDYFAAACDHCGVILSITPRMVQGETTARGAIAGAIIGGVVGHQFGSGSGNKAATAAGAVSGAITGNEIERRHNTYAVYDLSIKMEKGGIRHLTLTSRETLHPGDRVEIQDGRVVPVESDGSA